MRRHLCGSIHLHELPVNCLGIISHVFIGGHGRSHNVVFRIALEITDCLWCHNNREASAVRKSQYERM